MLKMLVYEIKPVDYDGGGLIVDDLRNAADCLGDIENEEVGNKYIIEVKEMARVVYLGLKEWGGF